MFNRIILKWLKRTGTGKSIGMDGLLKEHGMNLHRPFADLLEDGIHELRMKITGDQVRVLYFFCFRDVIVLTHDFNKTSDKVPAREIALAKMCRMDFLNRYNEQSAREL